MKSDSNRDLACQSYAGLNLCPCILIGVFHEAHILFWNTLLSQTPPDFLPWYPVVRLLNECLTLTTNALPSIRISCDAYENVAKTIRICFPSEF